MLLGCNVDSPAFLESWKPLEKLGCTFEQGPVVSVDVPEDANIYKVYDLLDAGERSGVWEFEEGHCGHLLAS